MSGNARGVRSLTAEQAADCVERWTEPSAIRETFVPASDHRYPHMA